MRKTDKKLDNQLRTSLTDVCEAALKDISGFEWLTHIVNYANFPQSLKVVCIFETNNDLDNYLLSNDNNYIQMLISQAFNELGIKLKNPANYVLFDTEENCASQHNGNWANRLTK